MDDDATADPNNEPHIDGCRLWLEFFGFDSQEQVKVTFAAHPPTGEGEQLLTWEGTVSDDPDAGDNDEDNVIPFNLSEALQPFEPHPEQGFHIKVSWDSVNAPGGEKHKVFWLQCNPVQPGTFRVEKQVLGPDPSPGEFTLQVTCNHQPANTEVMLTAGGSQDIPVPMGTTCTVSEANSQGAAVSFTETPGDGTNDGQAQVTGDAPAVVTVVNTFSEGSTQEQSGTTQEQPNLVQGQPSTPSETTAVQPVGTVVAGVSLIAPAAVDTLPRTGAGSTRPLAGLGSGALGVGAVALLLSRRRR